MLFKFPLSKSPRFADTLLHEIKPGCVIELISPDGQSSVYQVCRTTNLENIATPFSKTMLVNLATGRILFKRSDLPVCKFDATLHMHLAKHTKL